MLIGISSFAQLSIYKDTVSYLNVPKPGSFHVSDTIYNNSSSPVVISWQKSGDAILSGWTGDGICEGYNAQCYGFDNTSHNVTIPANGKEYIYVTMGTSAAAVDGCSYTTVRVSAPGESSKYMTYKYCVWPTSTKDLEANNIVNIYPNPASDYVNITFNDKKINSVQVVNIIGRKVAKFDVDVNKSTSVRVPLDNISNGIYMLQFADANGKLLGVKRVTKQ